LVVGVLAISTLLSEAFGVGAGPIGAIAALDTQYAGYLLAAGFAVIFCVAALLWRRTRRAL
jgi:high-affinity nickel-transport protein